MYDIYLVVFELFGLCLMGFAIYKLLKFTRSNKIPSYDRQFEHDQSKRVTIVKVIHDKK